MRQNAVINGINNGAMWNGPGILGAPVPVPAMMLQQSHQMRLDLHALDLSVAIKSGVVVPVNGVRDIEVHSLDDLDDVIVEADDDAVLSVWPHAGQARPARGLPSRFSLALSGRSAGSSAIRIRSRAHGFEMANLRVRVKESRTWALRVWFVTDSAAVGPRRTPQSVKAMLEGANRVMVQANADFYDQHMYVRRTMNIAGLRYAAGGIDRARIEAHVVPALVEHHDPAVLADVLLVRALATGGSDGLTDDMVTLDGLPNGAKAILVQDRIEGGEDEVGTHFAHELTHLFTRQHGEALGYDAEGHSTDEHDLMFRTSNSFRVRLNLPELDLINP